MVGATRARAPVELFAAEHRFNIVGKYVENELRAKLARPEPFRLIADFAADDVLLIEQVDRLSRLTAADWQKLRADLDAKQIRVVALDLSISWMLAGPADDFTGRRFRALNPMMLDMVAAIARNHYDDRRRQQAQGVAKAKAEGKYRGRPKTQAATSGLLRCCATVRHGRRFSTRLRMQPGDDRQGRQASCAGIARRADELLDAAVYPASVVFRPNRRRNEPVARPRPAKK